MRKRTIQVAKYDCLSVHLSVFFNEHGTLFEGYREREREKERERKKEIERE